MRTLFLLTALLLTAFLAANAQYYYIPANINPPGNPGGLNTNTEEPFDNGMAPGWTIIDPIDNSPAYSAVQNIPFAFQFNGQPVTQYKVSNTGILTFTTSATSVPGSNNNILPDPLIPDKSVCVWGIYYTGGNCNDRIVTKTFGTAPNRQHWIQFNTYNHPGQFTQWTYIYISIVLEESTNNIYVVDQRVNDKGHQPTLTIGVQINATTATMVTGSPNLGSVAGTSKTAVDNKYYTFIHGYPPTRDVGVSWLQIGNFLILNTAPFQFKGKVKNYTANMVNDYDINYSVNNGPAVACNMTGAAFKIPGYGEEWFIHDSFWTPPGVGIYHLKFWATNINGGGDQNNSNDTMYKTIEVSNAFTPKLRLFEEFTSSTCLVCKDANVALKALLNQFPNEYALIKYPMNYPDAGDPYYTAEAGVRKSYYNVDSLPDMYVHGTVVVDPMYIDTTMFNNLWDKSSMMFYSPYHTRSGNTFNVSASILPFEQFNQGTLVLRWAVVENVTYNNTGNNGETAFYATFKKFIPDANGVNLGTLQQGVFKNITRSYTFPTPNTIENWNNLSVIAFVQDDATKEVYQAAYSTLTSSIDENAGKSSLIRMVPNPAAGETTLEFFMNQPGQVGIEVLTTSGKLVSSQSRSNLPMGQYQERIDLTGLSSGLYMIRLTTPAGTDLAKLLVR
jgi:hypothetical protein